MNMSFLFGGQVSLTADALDEYYARSAAVRRVFTEASDCAGIDVEDFRSGEFDAVEPEYGHSLSAMRHAALVLGLVDELAAHEIVPDAVGGLSLGALISACVAGAVPRQDLFSILFHRRLVPPLPDSDPAQGMMLVGAPFDDDPANYHEPRREGLYLAVDTGPVDLDRRSFVLSGYVSALNELVESAPENLQLYMLEGYRGAFHSPLQRHAVEFMESFVNTIDFRPPTIPICSPVTAGTLATAHEVRNFVVQHNLLPARYEPIIEEMDRIGCEAGLVVGPGLPAPLFQPFPVELFTELADFDRLPELMGTTVER